MLSENESIYYRRKVLNMKKVIAMSVCLFLAVGCAKKEKGEKQAQELTFQAMNHFEMGQYDDSIQCFKKALKLNISRKMKADLLNNYACVLAQQKKENEALPIWNQLILNEEYATPEVAFYNMAKVSLQKGDIVKADQFLTRALECSPSYVDAHYYHAISSHLLGNSQKAQQECALVLTLEPEHRGALSLQKQLLG